MSWNEVSPVFSLTHWIPLGEKIENPDDAPTRRSACTNNAGGQAVATYQYIGSPHSYSSPRSTSYLTEPRPPSPIPSVNLGKWQLSAGSSSGILREETAGGSGVRCLVGFGYLKYSERGPCSGFAKAKVVRCSSRWQKIDLPGASPVSQGLSFLHHPATKDQKAVAVIPFSLTDSPALRCI